MHRVQWLLITLQIKKELSVVSLCMRLSDTTSSPPAELAKISFLFPYVLLPLYNEAYSYAPTKSVPTLLSQ